MADCLCLLWITCLLPGPGDSKKQALSLPVTLQVEVTPDERIKFLSFRVQMVSMEADPYFEENPGMGVLLPFNEQVFQGRRYKKIYSFKGRNKKKGDFQAEFNMALPHVGVYVVYLFFDEISWIRKKNVSRRSTNHHYAIQTLWYPGKGRMNLRIILEEVATSEALEVSTLISMAPE